jgi:hypothetical protein
VGWSAASAGALVFSPAVFQRPIAMIETNPIAARIADLLERVTALRGYL